MKNFKYEIYEREVSGKEVKEVKDGNVIVDLIDNEMMIMDKISIVEYVLEYVDEFIKYPFLIYDVVKYYIIQYCTDVELTDIFDEEFGLNYIQLVLRKTNLENVIINRTIDFEDYSDILNCVENRLEEIKQNKNTEIGRLSFLTEELKTLWSDIDFEKIVQRYTEPQLEDNKIAEFNGDNQ